MSFSALKINPCHLERFKDNPCHLALQGLTHVILDFQSVFIIHLKLQLQFQAVMLSS